MAAAAVSLPGASQRRAREQLVVIASAALSSQCQRATARRGSDAAPTRTVFKIRIIIVSFEKIGQCVDWRQGVF
jgi:hypothetical protein